MLYILNTTCVCFRHTHERVDQFFSRLSVALNRQTALTLRQLLVILENAYRPAAVFEPLNWVIDFKTWLTPHLKPKRKGTSKPHQFVIRKADVPTGATIQTALWSHTELKEPFEIFNTLPTGTPFVVAGRSLFHVTPASKGDKKANAAAATGVATDRWAGFSKQLADISTRYTSSSQQFSRSGSSSLPTSRSGNSDRPASLTVGGPRLKLTWRRSSTFSGGTESTLQVRHHPPRPVASIPETVQNLKTHYS